MNTTTAHAHGYRADLGTHWCYTCGTCSDYCQQDNPHDDGFTVDYTTQED